MPKWYELEVPITVITEHGEFRYYREYKRLQVSKPKWRTLEGDIQHGKTVTVDISKLMGGEELKNLLNLVAADLD